MTIRNLLILILFLINAGACQSAPGYSPTPTATPNYRIGLSPALPYIREPLEKCAEKENISTTISTKDSSLFPDLEEYDLYVWWGPTHEFDALSSDHFRIYALGKMRIVPVAVSSQDLPDIPSSLLSSLFQGLVQDWSVISPDIEPQSIQPITYPQNHPLRIVFATAILPESNFSPIALVAPTPEAMQEILSSHPGAIGYLPEPLVAHPLQALSVENQLPGLQQPVTGIISHQNPEALLRVVQCLNDNLKN